MDEKEIVFACQNGHLEEFSKLYEKYLKKIYNFVYFRTCSKELAEDITSDAFMKALEKINMLNLEKGSFLQWIYTIARNLISDHFRANKENNVDINDFWDIKSDDNVQCGVKNRLKILEVKKFLQKLKPEHREIVLMRIWDDMSFKEIALLTSKTEENCKTIFCRSMRLVRDNLDLVILLLTLKTNL